MLLMMCFNCWKELQMLSCVHFFSFIHIFLSPHGPQVTLGQQYHLYLIMVDLLSAQVSGILWRHIWGRQHFSGCRQTFASLQFVTVRVRQLWSLSSHPLKQGGSLRAPCLTSRSDSGAWMASAGELYRPGVYVSMLYWLIKCQKIHFVLLFAFT